MLFPLTTWLGIGVDYILAAALIAGGGYVAFVLAANPLKPLSDLLHYVGLVLIAAGLILGSITFGKSLGASACEAAWKAKNYEAQIERLQQEAHVKDVAIAVRTQAAQDLASQKEDADVKVADYERSIEKLSQSLRVCRAATRTDDERLCDIIGAAAAGCKRS